jgi:hypothetical protein
VNIKNRSRAIYFLCSIIFTVLCGYSGSALAKPGWKMTADCEYYGKRRGRKWVTCREPVSEPVVDDTTVIPEEPVSEPVVDDTTVIPEEPVSEPVVNVAPLISGQPTGSGTENVFYEFVPFASDADGDPLVFVISNQPVWADFDPLTGALYGTPTSVHAGTYSNIEIAVTDGEYTVALSAFSVDVQPAPMVSVMLNWQPPQENTDGTVLTNLTGYRIYYLDLNGQHKMLEELSNPGLSSYMVEDLAPGIWKFAMTALNNAGIESDFSNLSEMDLH